MTAFRTYLLFCVLSVAGLCSAQQAAKTYIGEISDSQCAYKVHSKSGGHTEMLKSGVMGNTAEDCTQGCVKGFGGKYVLVIPESKQRNRDVYQIAEQEKVAPFAGKKVKILGAVDDKTKKLHVHSVERMM